MIATCYMCEAVATSSEHAPPQCLFPPSSTCGEDLRRNLITVPSCERHNSANSKDDQFLRSVLLLACGQHSDVARSHFFDKELRSVRRKPWAHASFIKTVGIRSELGEMLEVDVERLQSCVERIARAIYFREYGSKWTLPFQMISPNLYANTSAGIDVPAHLRKAIEATRLFLGASPVKGDNPKVFMFRARRDGERQVYAFGAVFYETFEVFCASSPTLAEAAV